MGTIDPLLRIMRCLLFALLLLYSCQSKDVSTEQSRFKDFVGLHDYEPLVALLEVMETKLLAKYNSSDLNTTYYSYLADRTQGITPLTFAADDCTLFQDFDKSGLLSKFCSNPWDSVYTEDRHIITVDGQYESIVRIPVGQSSEEYLKVIEKEGWRDKVHDGSFYPAIKYSTKDTLLHQLANTSLLVGDFNRKRWIEEVRRAGVDFKSEPLYKFVVMVEWFYRDLQQYGC